jgi:hypothetical protein
MAQVVSQETELLRRRAAEEVPNWEYPTEESAWLSDQLVVEALQSDLLGRRQELFEARQYEHVDGNNRSEGGLVNRLCVRLGD